MIPSREKLIEESWNPIVPEAHQYTPKSDILRCYLLLMIISMKKKRSHFIISNNIPDQRIQQFDWSRDKTGHTQSKLAVPDAILPWWAIKLNINWFLII